MRSINHLRQPTAHRGEEGPSSAGVRGHTAHQRALLLLEVIPEECRICAEGLIR